MRKIEDELRFFTCSALFLPSQLSGIQVWRANYLNNQFGLYEYQFNSTKRSLILVKKTNFVTHFSKKASNPTEKNPKALADGITARW